MYCDALYTLRTELVWVRAHLFAFEFKLCRFTHIYCNSSNTCCKLWSLFLLLCLVVAGVFFLFLISFVCRTFFFCISFHLIWFFSSLHFVCVPVSPRVCMHKYRTTNGDDLIRILFLLQLRTIAHEKKWHLFSLGKPARNNKNTSDEKNTLHKI